MLGFERASRARPAMPFYACVGKWVHLIEPPTRNRIAPRLRMSEFYRDLRGDNEVCRPGCRWPSSP